VILLLSVGHAFTADRIPHGDHKLTFKSTFDESEQPYRLYVPRAIRDEKPLPLLLVLHGKGVGENAWFDYTPVKEVAEIRGYLVAAPYARGDWFYRGPAEQDVLDILDDVEKRTPVNPDRVYLMGHSMGGWGTWWIGLRHADQFVTICPMAGPAPMELLPNALYLDPFVIHDTDDPVVAVANSREAVKELVDLGIPVRYREETGYGHRSKMIGDNFHRLFDWMDRHQKVNHPRRVTLTTRTPLTGRAFWVRLLETETFPQLATFDATLDTSGTVHVRAANVRSFALNLDAIPQEPRGSLAVEINKTYRREYSKPAKWWIFTRKGDSSGWAVEQREGADLPRYESPVVAPLAKELTDGDNQAYLARALAERLRNETEADACFVGEDFFRLPRRPVTADAVLDAFIRGESRVARFKTTAGKVQEYIDGLSPTGRFLWGPCHLVGDISDPSKAITVVAPLRLAKQMEVPLEVLPETVPDYLYRSVRSGEPFP